MSYKFLSLIVTFCFSIFLTSAQDTKNSLYLFPKFEKGRAFYKGGGASSALFNYNMTTHKILFMSDSTILELANPSEISYINIDNRTFVQVSGSKYYEKIAVDSVNLYVYWNAKLLYKGKKEGYGIVSQTSASTQLQSMDDVGSQKQNYSLETNSEYSLNTLNSYFLKVDGRYKQFNSIESLANLSTNNKNEIIEKLKSEKLNFRKLDDVIKAISLCSQYLN